MLTLPRQMRVELTRACVVTERKRRTQKGRKEVVISTINQLLLLLVGLRSSGVFTLLLCCNLRRTKGEVRWRQPIFNVCDLCDEACPFPLPWVTEAVGVVCQVAYHAIPRGVRRRLPPYDTLIFALRTRFSLSTPSGRPLTKLPFRISHEF